MNQSQLAHVWAQQTKASGKSASMFFEDRTIYSYGRHFPIATYVSPSVVLFSTREHSVTTAGHKSDVRRAIPPNATIFFVVNPVAGTKPEHLENFLRLKESAIRSIDKIKTARSRKATLIARTLADIEHANRYAAHFKLGRRIKLPGTTIAALESLAIHENQRQLAADRIRFLKRERAERELRERAQVVLADWLAGGIVQPDTRHLDGVRFRIRGDNLQSTLGAEFPIAHALRAWPSIVAIQSRGDSWQRNGHAIHLGEFQIDSIDVDGTIVAGCHRVSFAEARRVAELIGAK